MKFTIAAVAAFAAAVNAQSECLAQAASIPACAIGYLVSAASSISSCDLVDFHCQCSASAQIQAAIAGNAATACTDLNAVIQGANSLCACASSNSDSIAFTGVYSSCQASAYAIPPCALGYLADAGVAIGSCSLDDFACQCSNSASIQASIAGDVASACGDVGPVLSSVNALCACATGGSGGGGSGSPSGTAAKTTAAGMAGASATGAATGSATASVPKATSGGSGSPTGVSVYTGAAAVPAVGGVLGALAGLVAML